MTPQANRLFGLRPRACCAVLVLTWIAAPVAALSEAPVAAPAGAGSQAELQRSEPAALMGERIFRRFEAIASLYEGGRYQEALRAVESYLRLELNDYERAMGEQMHGYVLLALDQLEEALRCFERAIELDALPNETHFALMRSVAQLLAAQEQWRQSIEALRRYLRYRPGAEPEDHLLMAQSHVQLERYREALPWVRAAIDHAGAAAQENWHQLELAIHFELGDHRAALGVLSTLVVHWPHRLRYWEMMAGAHQALEQDTDALAALMAAYDGGLITEERKLLDLVRMNLYLELPYQGGRILGDAIAARQVEANEANLRLLLQAWTAAREFDLAAELIDELAPLTGDGELLIRKARLMMEQNRWQATVDAAQRALELGNVREPGQAWLLIGIALMELDRLRESREALQRARDSGPDTRRQAREWQRFVEDRIEVAELRGGR
jgi:tetratricopeptide (TPR) repeat protein